MYIPFIDIDWVRGLIGFPVGVTILGIMIHLFNGDRFVEICRTAIFGPPIFFCVYLLFSAFFLLVDMEKWWSVLVLLFFPSLLIRVLECKKSKKVQTDYPSHNPNIYVDDKSKYLYGYKFARKYKDAKEIIEYRGLYRLLEELRVERFEMTKEETEEIINKVYSFPIEDKNHIRMILEIEALLNKNLRYNESSKFKRFVDELFGRI